MNDKPSLAATVYLVGAGPGDPKLLSMRGAELLKSADLVLYDYLVNPVITAYANRDAELVCLGRHGHGRLWTQDEIHRAIASAALAGKTVVRLKGGDPSVFGRLATEASFLADHEIPFEVVPGVTAASAASAYAGVLLTSRQRASAVALVTGHELRNKKQESLDFQALASFPGTLVIYMGVTTADHWVSQLVHHGKSADTPVALIRRCSFPDQQLQRCRLIEVPDRLTPYSKFAPPVLAIVGEIVDQESGIDWFFRRPMLGKTALVTRPQHQHSWISQALADLGAYVLHQPALEIRPAAEQAMLRAAVAEAKQYDWIVFSSANGVRFFLDAMWSAGFDARQLGNCRLAAIGSVTAAALRPYGLCPDVVPGSHRAEALAECLREPIAGQSVLLVRASRGREVLAETLASAANSLQQVIAYESVDVEAPDEEVFEALAAGRVDWTTVTSSAIARSLVRMFGTHLQKTQLVSISPVTTATLEKLGFPPAAEAKNYTSQGIVDAIVNGLSSQSD